MPTPRAPRAPRSPRQGDFLFRVDDGPGGIYVNRYMFRQPVHNDRPRWIYDGCATLDLYATREDAQRAADHLNSLEPWFDRSAT